MFADQAPFNELPEGIEIEGLGLPLGLITCAENRSIFISDRRNNCIWKIQMPSRELIRWNIHPRSPSSLSITPDMELLAVVYEVNDDFYDDDDEDDDVEEDYEEGLFGLLYLQVHRPTDGSLTRSMRLPREVQYVSCAAKLPNETFAISFGKSILDDKKIGILSMDGENLCFIRTLDLGFFESIKLESSQSWEDFVVNDDGEIFLVDMFGCRVIWFNSKLTDYRIISNKDGQLVGPTGIIYSKEKQQLMVCESEVDALTPGPTETRVSIFHLSPCRLAKERSEAVTGEN